MGIGDDIMATAEVRRVRRDNPGARIFVGDGQKIYKSEAFEHNPNISTYNPRPGDLWIYNRTGHRPYIDYSRGVKGKIAFTDYQAKPGDLYFSKIEEVEAVNCMNEAGVERKQFIVLEPNVKQLFSSTNKDWGWHKWEALMPMLKGLKVVQFDYGKPILAGARKIRTPYFRLACAVVQHAAAVVTTDGGLHHAAAAVGTPGVVIWGGYSPPSVLGYDLHENIFPDDPDSPCGNRRPCDHCRRVMESIEPTEVAERLQACLNDRTNQLLSHVW